MHGACPLYLHMYIYIYRVYIYTLHLRGQLKLKMPSGWARGEQDLLQSVCDCRGARHRKKQKLQPEQVLAWPSPVTAEFLFFFFVFRSNGAKLDWIRQVRLPLPTAAQKGHGLAEVAHAAAIAPLRCDAHRPTGLHMKCILASARCQPVCSVLTRLHHNVLHR